MFSYSHVLHAHCKAWHPHHCILAPAPTCEEDPDLGDEGEPHSGSIDNFSRGWRICNTWAIADVFIAYSVKLDGEWQTKGWRKIAPNRCSVIVNKLETVNVYYYGKASTADGGTATWRGSNSNPQFCFDSTNKYTIQNTNQCSAHYTTKPFRVVDKVITRSLPPICNSERSRKQVHML